MTGLLEQTGKIVGQAFEAAGYDASYGRITISNRPDLCEFQCNGAMAAKKAYNKAPREIAEDVLKQLEGSRQIKNAQVAGPGFINFDLTDEYIASYVSGMSNEENLGYEKAETPKKIIIDYGGPNVAKPLHIGHLRSAIIGESIKRIARFAGHEAIGDVHLGDWGLQMGLIIAGLSEEQPELPYFDPDFEGEYPSKAPFTISELETIYPAASARSKTDEEFKEKALKATSELQAGRRGYRALWQHIMNVSLADLKRNYDRLNVSFELWKGESDVQPLIPDMVEKMVADGHAYEDEGALIVDVKQESDTKEVPPCIIRKSDGASLYATTDLATLQERMALYDPDRILYVVDKRQAMHFEQVFRCAKKTGIVRPDTELQFLGFGTMNGKDGHPFKTRQGGVMRLETLIDEIEEEMVAKIATNASVKSEDVVQTAKIVALSALKYADLSNQASKDYIFDPEKFTSFEGNTGPYILYTIVRINSIIEKFESGMGAKSESGAEAKCASGVEAKCESGAGTKCASGVEAKCESGAKCVDDCVILPPVRKSEKDLMLSCAFFSAAVDYAYAENAPHRICSYIYELANAFNHFYHETKILAEENEQQKESWIALIHLVRKILNAGIDMLGFAAPERM